MSNKRPLIRAALKALIATQYTGTIETVRRYHSKDRKEFVLINFPQGTLGGQLKPEYDTVLEVAILIRGAASDDDLDAIGLQVETAIDSDTTLNGLVTGLVSQGFEYPDDVDERYNMLVLRYSIKYPY